MGIHKSPQIPQVTTGFSRVHVETVEGVTQCSDQHMLRKPIAGTCCVPSHTWSPHARSNLVLKASNNNNSSTPQWDWWRFVKHPIKTTLVEQNAFNRVNFCLAPHEPWTQNFCYINKLSGENWSVFDIIFAFNLLNSQPELLTDLATFRQIRLNLQGPARPSKGSAPGNWSKPLQTRD